MQRELKNIGSQLKAMQKGYAWHGKALEEALENLSWQDALQAPFPEVHSIWEYVLHIMAWRTFATERIKGNAEFHIEIGGEIDWPKVEGASAESWQEAKTQLTNSSQILRDLLREQEDSLLEMTVAKKPYSFYILLHGIVQHDAYHCGQIVLTRKFLEQSHAS